MGLTPTTSRTGGSSGGETLVSYTEFTSSVSVSAVAGNGDLVVAAPAFSANGTSTYRVEFYAGNYQASPTAARSITPNVTLDGAVLFSFGQMVAQSVQVQNYAPLYLKRYVVFAAGSRTVEIRCLVSAGTGTIVAGTGTAAGNSPGWLRITLLTQTPEVSLTPDQFSSLEPSDKLTVLYSQIAHLRGNVKASGEAVTTLLREYDKNVRGVERRVTVLETRLSLLGLLGVIVLGVALAALAKAAGL